jgi:AcrR family transcriptional regulator
MVLEAARDAFWFGGFEGTSMDDLTTATGLGKGSLYAAFGGKRELFERVFADHCAEAVEQTHRQLDGPDAGAYERLRKYVADLSANPGPPSNRLGCLIAKTTAEIGATDPVIGKQTRAIFEELAKTLTTTGCTTAWRHCRIGGSAEAWPASARCTAGNRSAWQSRRLGRDAQARGRCCYGGAAASLSVRPKSEL